MNTKVQNISSSNLLEELSIIMIKHQAELPKIVQKLEPGEPYNTDHGVDQEQFVKDDDRMCEIMQELLRRPYP